MLPHEPQLIQNERNIVEYEAFSFLTESLENAPWHLKIAERLARLTLWVWLIPRFFYRSPEKKIKFALLALQNFEKISVPTYNIIRLYRSFIFLAFYENEIVAKSFNIQAAKEYQYVQRSLRTHLLQNKKNYENQQLNK